MSNYGPGRRQATQFAVEVGAQRETPVAAHVGSRGDFLDRLQSAARAAHSDATKREAFLAGVFEWAVDTRNLYFAWQWLKAGDGHSPGSDELTYSDIPEPLTWEFLRHRRLEIVNDEYQPAQLREVKIPKGAGRGTRTLELPSVIDRMVGRAILQAVQPFLDPAFSGNSFGSRPRRDRRHALARAETLANAGGRWCWIAQDIKNAFPSVPRGWLRDVLSLKLRNEELITLIMKLLDNGKRRGIVTGQPLCPLVFNTGLDHILDRPWRRQHPDIPLLRAIDDLLGLCRDRGEAENAHADLDRMLRPHGMLLKHPIGKSIVDLSAGGVVQWLGFQIRKKQEEIQVNLTEDSWEQLEEHLHLSHEKPNSPLRAQWIVEGWLDQTGPALQGEKPSRLISRILSLARTYAIEEMPSRAELLQCLDRAQVRWQQIREAAYRELEQEQCSGSATCHRVFPSCHGGGEPALGSPLPALSRVSALC